MITGVGYRAHIAVHEYIFFIDWGGGGGGGHKTCSAPSATQEMCQLDSPTTVNVRELNKCIY